MSDEKTPPPEAIEATPETTEPAATPAMAVDPHMLAVEAFSFCTHVEMGFNHLQRMLSLAAALRTVPVKKAPVADA